MAGIDVGGTFTDLLLYERGVAQPKIKFAKVPTTVPNQADGVLAAIAAAGVAPADLDLVIHGTTATTNAILERKIAKVGLITTRGFRDTLELGRRTRPETLRPLRHVRAADPARASIRGRRANGRVGRDHSAARARRKWRRRRGRCSPRDAKASSSTSCIPTPTRRTSCAPAKVVESLWPNDYVTLGHELLSEFREYERGTTASVNAAVQPILDRYISRLQGDLESGGFRRDLLVMNGNGGTVSARLVAREAAKTVMSGPASGVTAAATTLKQSGLANAITYDMGGTSTDVALIHGGMPEVSSELTIDYGLPIHVPMVDVRTVGAGGGSIAWINAAGMLQVGPESAGSSPGPICYGRGGTRPTITDAHLLLGRLDPAGLTGTDGAAALEPVRAAIDERDREAARPLARGRRGRDPPPRQRAYGGRDPPRLAVARLRPARLRALRLRRRGAAARGRDRARARHSGGGRAGAAGPDQRARLPRRRSPPGHREHDQPAARSRSNMHVVADTLRAQREQGEKIERRRAGADRRDRSSCTPPTCSSAARRT